jgi:outer membrane protein OmpU
MMTVAQSDLVLSGSGEVTYTTTDGVGVTGNPFGVSQTLSFTGTGELDNGYSYSFFSGMAGQDMTFDSGSFTLDMGDMGAVGIDQGVGLYGIGTIALSIPTAYEEADHGVGVLADGLDNAGDTGMLGYIGSFGDVKVNIEYDPSLSAGVQQAGANGGASSGSNTNWALTYTGVEGLALMAGASKTEYTTAGETEDTERTAAVKYTMGAISVGYQTSKIEDGTAGVPHETVEAYGAAFNVNDNLSISIGQNHNEQEGVTDATEESTGVQAAYTMGSASVRVALNSADNVGGVTGISDENLELSLKLSF